MGLIVLDHEELSRRMRGLREGGKRIVFTNGCFDLLHVGHVRCLIDAASRGDFLVVAINSDESVRKLKGAGRPVQSERERAELLCALTPVSYVTIFNEPTCGPLLRKLRPQAVAKGTDYNLENLPEKDVLSEIGAELLLVGDPKRHSTIDLLERIRGGRGAGKSKEAKPSKPTKAAKAPAPARGKAPKPAAKSPPQKARAAHAAAAKKRAARPASEAHA